MNANGGPTVTARPAGWRRLLFPESWPATVRAGLVLAAATWVTFGSLWRAPWLDADFALLKAARLDPLEGWPAANASLLLDHAWAGFDARAHQVSTLGLHFLTALFLFAVLRFALSRAPGAGPGWGFFPPLGAALVWLLHPTHVDVLSGIAGRGSVLAGTMLLLALWAFATGVGRKLTGWKVLAIAAVAVGMLAHGTMLAAPWLLLAFDRAFLASSWGEVRAERGRWHFAFFAAAGLGLAVAHPGLLAGGLESILPQVRAAGWYLQRAVWPHPQVYDHGPDFSPVISWAPAAVLVFATAALSWRNPRVRFVAVGFWLTLLFAAAGAAGGGVVGEFRLAVPLIALAMAAAMAVARFGRAGGLVLAVIAVGLGILSHARTAVHASAVALWTDTVARAPSNPRAHLELAQALAAAGRVESALEQFDHAVQLAPRDPMAHLHLAGMLVQAGRLGEAVAEFETCLKLAPNSIPAHLGLAALQFRLGRAAPATAHYEAAARLGVRPADMRRHQGRVLAEAGRFDEALVELDAAVKLSTEDAETRLLRGMVLSAAGRPEEGMKEFVAAVRLDPEHASAHAALGDALVEDHRPAEALSHYETALRLQPARSGPLHASMGGALILLGRAAEAIAAYEEALRANPDDDTTRTSLERVRTAAERHGGKKK